MVGSVPDKSKQARSCSLVDGPSRILLHPESFAKLNAYRQKLQRGGLSLAGNRLQVQLADIALDTLNDEPFLEYLLATKPPLIFAESAVYGDGRDWNPEELSILGDVGVAVPVVAFDDGKHFAPAIHPSPLPATLLFIPGALLRNGTGNTPADWAEVTRDGKLDPVAYQALYERRLLPLFLYANAQAGQADRKALITVPGLGCGQFAGPFAGQLGLALNVALKALLEKHADRLPHVQMIYYDPYRECQNERTDYGSLSYRVRPLTQGNENKPQLCEVSRYQETGDDFSQCQLFSIVAWDHVSWPGNDFYGGSRCTDDGVKAAATNTMQMITGIPGDYDPFIHQYMPPAPYRTWSEVVNYRRLRLKVEGNLLFFG
jgi:hypothetical protein